MFSSVRLTRRPREGERGAREQGGEREHVFAARAPVPDTTPALFTSGPGAHAARADRYPAHNSTKTAITA